MLMQGWIRSGLQIAASVVVSLGLAAAQTCAAQSVPLVGYAAAKGADPKRLAVLKQGLRELGYVEGKNIVIDCREAVLDGEYDGLIAGFLASKVSLILAANAPAAVAAANATKTVPIVMLAVNDPVGLGLVKSLQHPGTNVTGTTMYAPQLSAERLAILRQLVPNLQRLSMVLNENNANNKAQYDRVSSEAKRFGIEVQALDIRKPEDVRPAFERARAFGSQALLNGVDSFINSQRPSLAEAAARIKIPFMYTDIEYVRAGGLMALGPGHYEGYYESARYVDKILHGADPADLAVAGATQFTFSVNRAALRRLELTLPPDIEAKVTEWVE